MKKIIAAVITSMLLVAAFVLVAIQSAAASTSSSWEVDVLGCHGGLTLYRSTELAQASQYEVDHVRRQIRYRGIKSVRLYRVISSTSTAPQQRVLVSRSLITCT